jgi:glycosyltransferase involved in cell wall biosynthesis
MPHDEVWQWYAGCDCGVVLSLPLKRHKVGLPVKMFEFMAAGLPVVVSDFPLCRDIVEGNRCGVCVDPENLEQVAKVIRRLKDDPETRREMGENGRRAVVEKYNWQAEAEKLLALYRAMLGTGSDDQ